MVAENADGDIYLRLTLVGIFLDMVARSLIAYESTTIPEILAQVKAEYEFDATELVLSQSRIVT